MARLQVNGTIRSSIEVSPKQAIEKDDIYHLIPQGERIYITDIGTASEEMIAAAARKITGKGYEAVPHIPARRFQSARAFENRIRTLTGECGVTSILAIAGEADRPGPFSSTLDLLETGLFDQCGIKHIAIAGHPEGAPDIKTETIRSFLLRKNEIARESDADFVIATQFGFDPERILAWLDEIKAWGNTLPVHIGIAGPAKMTTLIKYAGMAGVSNSMNFLKKRGGALLTMLGSYNPDDVVAPLERHLATKTDTQLAQMHVYPFGGVAKCAEWLYARGTWERTTADVA